ncbi:carboxypeptidase regulatory-like domain-containing protein [Candidatus Riflebacteria bacterium]
MSKINDMDMKKPGIKKPVILTFFLCLNIFCFIQFYGCGQVVNGIGEKDIHQITNVSPPVKKIIFKGTVQNSETKKGIPFARITNGQLTGLSNEDGSFSFSNFPAGKSELNLYKEGYTPHIFQLFLELGSNEFIFALDPNPQTIVNDPGDYSDYIPGGNTTSTTSTTSTSTTTTTALSNINYGAIRGKILVASGSSSLPLGKITLSNNRNTFTDQDGNYFLSELPPGSYDISVEVEGFPEQEIGRYEVKVLKIRNIPDYTLKTVNEMISSGWNAIGVQTFSTAETIFTKLETDNALSNEEKLQSKIGKAFSIVKQGRYAEAEGIFEVGLVVQNQEDRDRARLGLGMAQLELTAGKSASEQANLGSKALSNLKFLGIDDLNFRWSESDLLRTKLILYSGDAHALIAYAFYLTGDFASAQLHFNLARQLGSQITFGLSF